MPPKRLPRTDWMFKPVSAKNLFRFWAKVDMRGPDECWPWRGHRNRLGYGLCCINRTYLSAHRFSFVLANGPPLNKPLILHSCDNPSCCNPRHLREGTQLDNIQEAAIKGRMSKKGGRRKLTAAKVREIRIRYSENKTPQAILAREYDVSKQNVSRITRGTTWQEI